MILVESSWVFFVLFFDKAPPPPVPSPTDLKRLVFFHVDEHFDGACEVGGEENFRVIRF